MGISENYLVNINISKKIEFQAKIDSKEGYLRRLTNYALKEYTYKIRERDRKFKVRYIISEEEINEEMKYIFKEIDSAVAETGHILLQELKVDFLNHFCICDLKKMKEYVNLLYNATYVEYIEHRTFAKRYEFLIRDINRGGKKNNIVVSKIEYRKMTEILDKLTDFFSDYRNMVNREESPDIYAKLLNDDVRD